MTQWPTRFRCFSSVAQQPCLRRPRLRALLGLELKVIDTEGTGNFLKTQMNVLRHPQQRSQRGWEDR